MIRLTAVIELEGQARRALTHESNAKTLVIGRDANSDFQIPLTTVSRRHIKIAETDNVYVVEDLGSTHGSLLNGKRLGKGEKKVLRDGDIIELTKARITCSIETEKVVGSQVGESTKMIADKALAGILGRLGEAPGEGPYFRVLSGPDEGQRLALGGAAHEWSLGRSKDCDFVLNDANVSRRHAVVKKDWDGITVQDLDSKNGVLVNDGRITKPRRLKDQDEVTVGPVKLLFIDPDAELMAALSHVPGFAPESGEFEVDAEEPSPQQTAADEEAEEGSDAAAPEESFETSLPAGEDELEGFGDQADEYASIDPELLRTDDRRFPSEWLIIGSVGVLVVACVLLLLLYL